jgi:aminoglycoside/choline kinase family phosphotransferase
MNIIESLHGLELRHGDFQPRNLIEDENGTIRVIDFQHCELGHICYGKACAEVSVTRKRLGFWKDEDKVCDTCIK